MRLRLPSLRIVSILSAAVGPIALDFLQRKRRELLEARSSVRALERALEVERERSRRDPLTGVLSRTAVTDELAALLASGQQPLAIALADIDGLKAVNDTYGQSAGDDLLTHVAQAVSRGDTLVGRYGGDEFLALLPGAGRAEAERFRDEVVAALTGACTGSNGSSKIPLNVSFGLAVYPDEAESADDLIRLAGHAMYASRRVRPVSGDPRFDGERAVQLISDIVPLLTSPGSREDKLRLVAHHISLGGGYDAVNIEVAGIQAESAAEWERTFVKAPGKLLDAWVEEQRGATDHPLGQLFAENRGPVFLDDLWTDERLTPAENEILRAAGLKCAVVVPMIWQDDLVGMLSVVSKNPGTFNAWDANFLSAIASHVTAIVFMTELVDNLRTASGHLAEAHAETVMMLAAAAEAHDHTTGRHLQRVRAMTAALARELGYGAEDAHTLGLAAVLHDVGKIRVPNSILSSPYKLSDEEWNEMRQHTIWGAQFLEGRRGFDLATLVARCHHERWDGAGYPQGLTGDEIPEAAAIASVADSFDAITSDRPYRAGRSVEEAVEEIEACSGKQFSPRVVEALRRLYDAGDLPLVEKHREDLAAAA